MKPSARLVVLLGLGFLALLSARVVPVARAAALVVTSTADSTANDAACTLREAVTNANDNAATWADCAPGTVGLDTINFAIPVSDPGCSSPNVCTISMATAITPLPQITDNLTLDGTGQKITLSGALTNRVLWVTSSVILNVNALTIADGAGGLTGGGGIFNNGGTLNVTSSAFTHNFAVTGGAIDNSAGIVNITNSTFYENESVSDIENGNAGNGGTMNVYNSTIDGSADTVPGGLGVINDSGTTVLQNTIVANENGGNCAVVVGSLTANTFNLSTDGTCDTATTSASINLGPFQYNGGWTQTMAISTGSSALDVGSNAVCNAAPVNGFDQRGITRPQNLVCDVGAYEFQKTTAVNVFGLNGKVNLKGDVILRWQSATELQISGFNVYRKTASSGWQMANRKFIQAKRPGDVSGQRYRFKDAAVKGGVRYWYKVEVVYADGHSEWTEVVRVRTR